MGNSGRVLAITLALLVLQAHAAGAAPAQVPAAPVGAAAGKRPSGRAEVPFKPAAPYTAAILMDGDSGEVLFAQNENTPWPPASMVKMMTVLIAMEQVRAGQLSLDEPIPASAWASSIGGSQVYLAEGEQFPLRDMLAAIMISSANDASMAVAERIGGTSDAFVERMNQRAQELGMKNTEFHTPHGLPPATDQKPDLMSATDLAILGRKLTQFPEIMGWAGSSEAPFRGGQFTMRNTNHLVRTYDGATGLKTGYYAAAGFEVTATASRDGLALIAVVLGAPTKQGSFDEAARLLSKGFAGWKAIEPVKAGQPVGAQISVSGGAEKFFVGQAAKGLRVVLPRDQAARVKVEVKVPAQVSAPVTKGQVVGEVVTMQGDKEIGRTDLVAPHDVARTSWWSGWF
ncbi:MAG: D-alanyl-D-alanine carboxypeptidase [Deltaproteobacteria bacterium]|nr:D-alanyl-D-alanine carboxypeptidase [Deltaproteobacteria bacterium]